MPPNSYVSAPAHDAYDVIIIGGAMMGAAAAWFTASDPDFDGRILVVDRDPSYANCRPHIRTPASASSLAAR